MELTESEQVVMRDLIAGKRVIEICVEHRWSENTVHHYATRARKKLGAKTRLQAAVIFDRRQR